VSEIPTACLSLSFDQNDAVVTRPHLLRGALANLFPDEPLLHQHGNGGLIYRYPLVHYRGQKNKGVLVGFYEGAHLLARLPLLDQTMQIGNVSTKVVDIELEFSMRSVGVARKLTRYYLVTPWIPFNQTNYESYKQMTRVEQTYERDRIAVGNLLTTLRGLKIEFPEQLYAAFQVRRSVGCRYKDKTFLGFLGTLITNVDLPDDIAIGRAVSHGYGWLKRIRNKKV